MVRRHKRAPVVDTASPNQVDGAQIRKLHATSQEIP